MSPVRLGSVYSPRKTRDTTVVETPSSSAIIGCESLRSGEMVCALRGPRTHAAHGTGHKERLATKACLNTFPEIAWVACGELHV